MTIQDDSREKELCRLFNLEWDQEHQRDGTDAYFDVQVGSELIRVAVEVKSTSGDTVATARDVGIDHINKWRRHFWVIGFYTEGKLSSTMVLTPDDLEPWIASIEQKILPDFSIASLAAIKLDLSDLFSVCGKKSFYTLEDARRLHKKQYSKAEYDSALDLTVDGQRVISPARMLHILQHRARYIARRGATLNNPHITSATLNAFKNSSRELKSAWAIQIREIARAYLVDNKNHPFS